MPQYRLFLIDRNNHIVGTTERECAVRDIKLVALDVLQSKGALIDGVEVWQGNQWLDHIKRS